MSPTLLLEKLNAVAPPFIDAAFRGAVVLLIALLLTYAMRRRTAAARHLVWVGAIVVQLLLPLFAIWGPRWELAVPASVASVSPIAIPAPVTERHISSTTTTERAGPSLRSGRQIESAPSTAPVHVDAARISGRTILLALWILGAVIVLARLAIGTTMVARLARKGARVDDGGWLSLAQRVSAALQIDRPLTLLRGDKLGVPVTWGIVYPVVLLPDDSDSWPEERRRFVLVHEMAHVKRLDALTQLAGQLALALFWFDPLVWIANRRMQLEREHACDDYVLRHGTPPSTYAEELLSMVRSLGTPDHRTAQPAFAALAMARRSEFEGRMLSILDPVLDRHPLSKGRTLMSSFAALLLVVPLAALHPYQRAAAAPAEHVAMGTPAAKSANAADELPESFKVSFLPVPQATDTAALAKGRFARPLGALTKGATDLEKGMAALGSEIVTISGKALSCDTLHPGAGTSASTHIHADDDGDGTAIIDYTRYNSERCVSATIIGRLKYSPNEDDIVEMPVGSHAVFRVHTTTDDRELTVARASDGTIQHLYRYNGRSADYDESARRWFASYLPTVLMEAGINVGPRVARWRAQGGVSNVLEHIAAMSSSGAKRSHYQALLDDDKLSGDELDKVVQSASETLRGSSGDLRAVLMRAAPNVRLSRQGVSAMERALVSMGSSGDKTAVLQAYGQTDDRDMLLMVMRVAEGIGSSGDQARLYQVLAARYLRKGDRVLVSSYLDHVKQIPSSGDMRNVLMIAIPYAIQSPDVARGIIEDARSIGSSGDKSQVLISLANSGAITTRELRDAFFAATAEIGSESDRNRVLRAAASLKP